MNDIKSHDETLDEWLEERIAIMTVDNMMSDFMAERICSQLILHRKSQYQLRLFAEGDYAHVP